MFKLAVLAIALTFAAPAWADSICNRGTAPQQLTCSAHLWRSAGEPAIAARLEIIAYQIHQGLLDPNSGMAAANQIAANRKQELEKQIALQRMQLFLSSMALIAKGLGR